MKSLLTIFSIMLICAITPSLMAENRVLELDGDGDYIRLPDNFRESLDAMREDGVVAGFAGHNPNAHDWINDNLDVDFQMCCYYNPSDRSRDPQHVSVGEKWYDEDRERMAKIIRSVKSSVAH